VSGRRGPSARVEGEHAVDQYGLSAAADEDGTTAVAPVENEGAAGALERFGLPRLIRWGVAGGVPPLWSEIALLHFRGSFQNKFMWIPVVYLPIEMAGGVLASAVDEPGPRKLFRMLSWGTAVVGGVGTYFHLVGARRQMGGFYNWRYNLMTGPPAMAPPQVALFGLLGVLSTGRREQRDMIRRLRMGNAVSLLFLALDSGSSHYQNYYQNRVQYTPLILAPALAAAEVAAESPSEPVRRAGRRAEKVLSAAAVVAGVIGFGFHLWNVRKRAGGFSWQNLFYGAPTGAPLQLSGQGALGLLAALFDARKEQE
jgi:hypothetical protein